MYKLLALIHFEDSLYDEYLAQFEFPMPVYQHELMQEIYRCREQLSLADFETPMDLADTALSLAASKWGGVWQAVDIDLFIDIDELDDPDPIEHEENEDDEEDEDY